MHIKGRPGLVRTGVSQYSTHNFDSKCIFVLCCLLVKDCISTLDFITANTGHSPKAVSMVAHRFRRLPDIETTLGECPVFAVIFERFFFKTTYKKIKHFAYLSGQKYFFAVVENVILYMLGYLP